MLNRSDTATSVRSPEESRWIRWVRLPRGARVDIDLALEWIVRIGQTQLAFAAAEQRLEYLVEVRLDRGEGLEEHGAGGPVDLADGLDQGLPGSDQVVALRGQELETLDLLGVLLDRQRVHGADRLESRDDAGGLRLERLDVEVEHGRGVDQLVEGPVPFRLDSLDDAPPSAGRLGQPHLERVTLLAGTVETPTRVGHLLLGITERRLGQGELGLRLRAGRLQLVDERPAARPVLRSIHSAAWSPRRYRPRAGPAPR